MKTALSEKGQVTIPKRIRVKLGLRPGRVIEFSERNGVLIGRKAETTEDPVSSVTGIVSLSKSVDDYLTTLRGESE